jgi:hypothetical protein
LTADLKAKDAAFEDSQLQLSKAKKEAYESSKKVKEYETSLEVLKSLTKEKERKIKELETNI